jgi:insulysin
LNKYELEEVLSATFIMDTIDKDLVFKYLDEMKKTDNLIILIGNDDY